MLLLLLLLLLVVMVSGWGGGVAVGGRVGIGGVVGLLWVRGMLVVVAFELLLHVVDVDVVLFHWLCWLAEDVRQATMMMIMMMKISARF